MGKLKKITPNYIRVGTDYFKVISKPDRFGIARTELKKWTKDEIKQDHLRNDANFLHKIPKYDDFIIEPDNNGTLKAVIDNLYNMYTPLPHEPKKGEWEWTKVLLNHIFGNQIDTGMTYLQVLYKWPKQALPILALVSEERQTGKTTFMDWLNMIFGANMTMIEPDVIGSNFNSEYATSNIIGIDETILDKQIAVEKIKSLATKKFISVNIKNVSQFKLPFFGKIILASNNEDKFMRIDEKEIRFWVRKIPTVTIENHNILNDMISEIPAFLDHLQSMVDPDFTKSRMVLTAQEIKNEFLDAVIKESKSGLFKEIYELLTDHFDNNETETIEFTPTDVKNKWFKNDSRTGIAYIRRVLNTEFNKTTPERVLYYSPFNDIQKKYGRPYSFQRAEFTDVNNKLPF